MKKLYRSRKNRVIAGIAGGLGEYFNVDPILIRLILIMTIFIGGGLLAYIIAWIVIPEKSLGAEQEIEGNQQGNMQLAGLLIICLGLLLIFRYLLPFPVPGIFWAIVMIIIGIFLIINAKRK